MKFRTDNKGEPGETGLIISPNYPAIYPPDYDCFWTMTGTEETDFVRLHWLAFELEMASSSGVCAWDKVQVSVFSFKFTITNYIFNGSFYIPKDLQRLFKVYKSTVESTSNLIGEYCGTDLPPSSSTHGSMMVKLITDLSREYAGFRAEYDFEQCGGLREGPTGTINGHTPS